MSSLKCTSADVTQPCLSSGHGMDHDLVMMLQRPDPVHKTLMLQVAATGGPPILIWNLMAGGGTAADAGMLEMLHPHHPSPQIPHSL